MENVVTLESAVKKHSQPITISENVLKKQFMEAEDVLKRIPKKTVPIEVQARELARQMFADSKYQQLNMSFMTHMKMQPIQFEDIFRYYDMKINISEISAPIFGILNYEKENQFSLHEVGQAQEVKLDNSQITNEIERHTTNNITTQFRATIPYNSQTEGLFLSNIPLIIQGTIIQNNRRKPFFGKPMEEVIKEEIFEKKNSTERYIFPDFVEEPFTLEIPADVRAEYNMLKKLDVFDNYFIIYETGLFNAKKREQSPPRINDGDPIFTGYNATTNTQYIIKMFDPTLREQLVAYSHARKNEN